MPTVQKKSDLEQKNEELRSETGVETHRVDSSAETGAQVVGKGILTRTNLSLEQMNEMVFVKLFDVNGGPSERKGKNYLSYQAAIEAIKIYAGEQFPLSLYAADDVWTFDREGDNPDEQFEFFVTDRRDEWEHKKHKVAVMTRPVIGAD